MIRKERGIKMEVVLNAEVYSKILIGILGLGIICKMWWGILYSRLLKETNNMSKTKNSKLRSIMLQFEKKYQVKKGVQNIELFVDKHMNQMRVGGLHMQNANRIALRLSMISIIFSSICAWWSYGMNNKIEQSIQYIIEGVLVGVILYGLDFVVDFENKRKSIRVNVQEYLENVLNNKLEMNNREIILTEKEDKVHLDPNITNKNPEKIEDSILFRELIEEIFP